METLRKTVNIGCLIYAVYGLISLVNLGVYVPPIPLKPILFIVFLVAYILVIKKATHRLLHLVFCILLLSMALTGQLLANTFLDYQATQFYQEAISPIFSILLLSSFVLMVYMLPQKLSFSKLEARSVWLMGIIVVPLSVVVFDYHVFIWGFMVIVLQFFLYRRKRRHAIPSQLEGMLFVLNGIAVISLIEQMAVLLQA